MGVPASGGAGPSTGAGPSMEGRGTHRPGTEVPGGSGNDTRTASEQLVLPTEYGSPPKSFAVIQCPLPAPSN